MQVQVCTRCVMDNRSDKTIKFLPDGTCNYCNEALKRFNSEYFPDDRGQKMLEDIMEKIKKDRAGKQYDCIVGLSGGVDSSYVLYLGYKYGLKMLAVHIDDGLDTKTAIKNIESLCNKTNTELLMVKPDLVEYRDLIRSFFLARVPNLAIPQDNVLHAVLNDTAKKYKIKYILSGANFALECILERSTGVNASDKKHIIAIHRQFGRQKLNNLRLESFYEAYIYNRYFSRKVKILPLNYIDYNLKKVLAELADFSGYEYYGGKHHESVLTRFLQCYYLPVKYGIDKRKSHFSSMIVSGQMTREEALKQLSVPPYVNKEIKEYDFNFLAEYIGMNRSEFDHLLSLPPKQHQDYPISPINKLAGIARKFRKYMG